MQGNVVCKQLGFTLGAENITTTSAYGLVNGTYSYYDIACVGEEITLDACPHSNSLDAANTYGAGVVCGKWTFINRQSPIIFILN